MRPSSPAGSAVLLLHLLPRRAAVGVVYIAEPGPPDLKNHGQRRYCHMLAISRSGLCGSSASSPQPVFSST
jgi:hypothetical protein